VFTCILAPYCSWVGRCRPRDCFESPSGQSFVVELFALRQNVDEGFGGAIFENISQVGGGSGESLVVQLVPGHIIAVDPLRLFEGADDLLVRGEGSYFLGRRSR
jgi:hypothetical protein